MLLWLTGAPVCDISSEDSIKRTEDFIDEIISCEHDNVQIQSIIARQVHKHSHTCRRGRTNKCRFNIPFFPMDRTRILTPIDYHTLFTENQLQTTLTKINELVENLPIEIVTIEQFLDLAEVSMERYLASIQKSLKRPKIFLRRTPQQLKMNPYSEKIFALFQSNMDIQFVLDAYSCAMYIVDYINKSNRGMSKLIREAIIENNNGNRSIKEKLRSIGLKFINATEVSAQEAAWSLLQLHMHECTLKAIFIATGLMNDRVRMMKSRAELERLDQGSVEVFYQNLFDHYSKRPLSLENLSLAEFAANYEYQKKGNSNSNRNVEEENAEVIQDNAGEENAGEDNVGEENAGVGDELPSNVIPLLDNTGYIRARKRAKIIKFRNFNILQDAPNFYREQLLLYHPHRNEANEIENVDHVQVSLKQKNICRVFS
jgi:hypothetical protein